MKKLIIITAFIFSFTYSNAITLSTTQTNVTCYGNCNGTATVIATGGAGGYTYHWSNAAATSSINGLCQGLYVVTVTDANSASATASVSITQPAIIVINYSVILTSCSGNCDGAITLSITGGIAPYTFNWNNGATTNFLNNLCTGNFCVTVTDQQGCTKSACITINHSTTISVSVSHAVVTCYGSCNGSATAIVSGGIAPYFYQWSNGSTASSISLLCSGSYCVTAHDASGCTGVACVTINQPSILAVNIAPTNPICTCNGIAASSASGGTAPYNYHWNNGATTAITNGLCSGTYYLTTSDSHGCSNSSNVVLSQGCPVPQNLIESALSSTSGRASWTTQCSVTLFEVQIKKSTSSTWGTGTTTSTNILFSGLSSSTTYNVRVRAKCGSTFTAYTPIVSFSTPLRLESSDDSSMNHSFSIYPNPTNGQLNLELPYFENGNNWEVKIIDMMGKEISTTIIPKDATSYLIDLSDKISNGTYFVHLNNGIKTFNRKIIFVR